MAQKKTGGSRSASSKTSSARSKKAAETRARKEAEERYHRQLLALGLFVAGLFLLFVVLIEGQKFWTVLHGGIRGLFGWCAFLVPPLLLYVAVMGALDRCVMQNRLWQAALLILLLCGVTHAFSVGADWEFTSLGDAVFELFESGKELQGGGLAAGVLGVPLIALLGVTGAKVTLILLLFVTVMILTGTTLHEFMKRAAKPVKKVEQAYLERAEERRAAGEQEARGGPRFNIDVPVEDAPMPQHPVQAPKPTASTTLEYTDSMLMAKERLVGIDFDEEPGETPRQEGSPRQEGGPQPEGSLPQEASPAAPEEKMPLDDLVNKALGLGANAFKPVYITEEDEERGEITPPQAPAAPAKAGRFHLSDEVRARIDGEYAAGDAAQEPGAPRRPLVADELPVEQVNSLPFEPGDAQEMLRRALEQDAQELSVDQQVLGALNGQAGVPEHAASGEELPWEDEDPGLEPGGTVEVPAAQGQMQVKFTETEVHAYRFPPVGLLKESQDEEDVGVSDELKANAQRLVDTLKSFGVQTRIIDICRGPAVTRYELQPSAGVKISKITGLADDIALNLASAGVRIEAPIPNKPAVGIEVPNKVISMVGIRELIDSDPFRDAPSRVTVALGKDISGNITTADIAKMPHVLIAGATGSGKSVCINSIIISLLYKATPDEVRLLMIDPKVVELGVYNGIPHLLVPVVTDPRKAAGALNWAVSEMLGRYKLFADNSVRDLKGYNLLAREEDNPLQPMPEIVIIIDELADLMMAAPNEVEDAICRLAQMARAAGMHLIIATQRPSVDVITGVIKANIPSRVAFAVSSQVDSRTILDGGGAEKLLGRGDMLFLPMGAAKPTRVQGCYVSDKEVEQVVKFIKESGSTAYDEEVMSEIERQAAAEKSKSSGDEGGGFDAHDEMLEKAIEVVVEQGQASTSMLQRKLKLGYARAARLVDEMEERGIVGTYEGSKPRQVLITRQQWIEMKMNADAAQQGVPEEI